MERIWTTQLARHAGEHVSLRGWLHQFRLLGKIGFLLLRDGKGIAQVVVDDPARAEALARLLNESVLAVEGTVVAEPKAPGGCEVREALVEVLEPAVEPPPLDLYRPTLSAQLPTLLDHAPLSLRHPRRHALFQLAAASVEGFRATLRALEFTEVRTPKLVASATEGGANLFRVDYFGRPAYLAQSPQLYKQIMVGVYERVFEVGPVFRAEPHDTPRHVNEYTSLDAELGFIADHRDVMAVANQVVAGMVRALREQAGDVLALLGHELPEVPAAIPALRWVEALALLHRSAEVEGQRAMGKAQWAKRKESGSGGPQPPCPPAPLRPCVPAPLPPCRPAADLSPADERRLGDWARREHGSDFLFVVGYPLAKRPFYTHPDPERPGASRGFDLLFRGLELMTGGQRLHRYADYLTALAERDMDPEPFAGYLEAFKHGMPPHGGFAIGLERWVAQLAGIANIREATLFPRDLTRLTP